MNALFLVSTIAAFIGVSMYVGELHHDRVSMATRWGDLDRYQWVAVSLAVLGAIFMVGSLIVGAILKGM